MTWPAIIGQPLAQRLLRHAVRTGRVAQAYLFSGPEGVGKRTAALELARALTCLHPDADGGACGTCFACRKMSADPPVHPDVAVIQPDGRFIKTDQIRALQAEMYERPAESKVRVAVIDGADRMNAEAGNRLLKLLEEPPPFAILILLTSNLSGVLPTIVSRCQVVNFPPLSPDAVASVLQRAAGLDPGEARLFAALSGGSIGQAQRLAADPTTFELRNETLALLGRLSHQDDFDLLGEAEALEKQKEHLDQWLEWLLMWLRDALLVAQTGSDALVLNADRLPEVQGLAETIGNTALLTMVKAVTDARRSLQRNANLRLTLDVLMLQLGAAVQRDTLSM